MNLKAAVLCLVAIAAPLAAVEETELKDDTGKTIVRYAIELPSHLAPAGTMDPAKQVGLFLCMPEHDRPTGDELMPVREALRRHGLSDGYVLIGASPQGRKFGAADHEPLQKLIAWAVKTYPINPRRIYMFGKGEGGKISSEFVGVHPDLITGAISYSWGFWRMPEEVQETLPYAPDLYMVLGHKDLSYHLTTVRDAYIRAKAKGYHIIYREFEDLAARTYHPPSNDDAILWATALRNRSVPPAKQELALLESFTKGKLPAIGPRGNYPSLALVGGEAAGAVAVKLLDSPDAEVRAAAAETFKRANFGDAAVRALAAKLNDPAPKVRKAVIGALGVHSNWRSETAQKALLQFAASAADAGDRYSAIDALAYAIRYQVRGARQDTPIFQAFVAMMDDKDEQVRAMATAVLLPVRDTVLKVDAGNTDKKAALAAWQHWAEEITAKEEGYLRDYAVCRSGQRGKDNPIDQFCTGGNHLLGHDLATNQPIHKDPSQAFKYTLQAAEQGYVPAEAAVAMMYANGKGTPQSYEKAGEWWSKAAEGGHILAASNLSLLYRGGSGVKPDKELSEKWGKVAEQAGR